jgi:hypothetical protein
MKIGILIIAHCGIGRADFYQHLGPNINEIIIITSFKENEINEEKLSPFLITRSFHEGLIIPIEIFEERLQKIEEASNHPPDHCARWQCQFRQRDKMVLIKLRRSLRPP